jgi:hypothetical protein
MTELSDAHGQQESADHEHYSAEHRREEREQTTLNLLKAEVGDRRSDRQQDSRYRKFALGVSIATLFVSFATMGAVIYYACVARGQYEAMRVANTHAEQSLQVQQRAYVHVEEVKLVRFEVGKTPEAIIYYKNTGLTPAESVLAIPSSLIRAQRNGPIEPQTPKEAVGCASIRTGEIHQMARMRGQVLPPAITRSINTTWEFMGWDFAVRSEAEQLTGFVGQSPLTAEQFTAVRTWRKRWYVVLFISYFDQFGRCHASAERFVYDQRDSNFHPTPWGWRQADD